MLVPREGEVAALRAIRNYSVKKEGNCSLKKGGNYNKSICSKVDFELLREEGKELLWEQLGISPRGGDITALRATRHCSVKKGGNFFSKKLAP